MNAATNARGRRRRRARPPCPAARAAPARSSAIRSPRSKASSCSCVTTTVVMPEPVHERAQFAPGALAEGRVEVRERFVEQEDARLRRERARQRHPLLLAARQVGHRAPLEAGQVHQRERLGHPAGQLRAVHAPALEPERHVGADVEVREERVVLEHHAEAPRHRRQRRHVPPVEHHASPRRATRTPRAAGASWSCRCRSARAARAPRRAPATGTARPPPRCPWKCLVSPSSSRNATRAPFVAQSHQSPVQCFPVPRTCWSQ